MKITSLCVDTTGFDFVKDQIISISYSTTEYDGTDGPFRVCGADQWIIKPERPYELPEIVPEKLHLTKDIIDRKGVAFSSIAPQLLKVIEQSDAILAYNTQFHINFLQYNFDLLGLDPHFEQHSIIDPYLIEIATNSHQLDEVYSRALGSEPASNTAEKALKLFVKGQMKTIDKQTIKEYRDQYDVQHYPDGWVKMDGEVLKFNKGQYKDQPVIDIIKKDTGYIKWLCKNNLVTMPTRKAFKAVIEKMKQEC